MKKKILNCFLFIFFFYILIIIYLKFNNREELIEKKKIEIIENENSKINEERIESSNIIEDVSYSAKDVKGNEYFVRAAEGSIDQNDSNYII